VNRLVGSPFFIDLDSVLGQRFFFASFYSHKVQKEGFSRCFFWLGNVRYSGHPHLLFFICGSFLVDRLHLAWPCHQLDGFPNVFSVFLRCWVPGVPAPAAHLSSPLCLTPMFTKCSVADRSAGAECFFWFPPANRGSLLMILRGDNVVRLRALGNPPMIAFGRPRA